MPVVPLVTIVEADRGQRDLLVALMQLYLYDLSTVESWEVDECGSFGVDDLDGCWTDPCRHPFFIRVDETVAGFAIGDEGSDVTGNPQVLDMAEFFVLRRWRHKGVGRQAVLQLFERFPGRWEIRPFPRYPPGEKFWHQICHELASGNVESGTFQRSGQPFTMYSLVTSSTTAGQWIDVEGGQTSGTPNSDPPESNHRRAADGADD